MDSLEAFLEIPCMFFSQIFLGYLFMQCNYVIDICMLFRLQFVDRFGGAHERKTRSSRRMELRHFGGSFPHAAFVYALYV